MERVGVQKTTICSDLKVSILVLIVVQKVGNSTHVTKMVEETVLAILTAGHVGVVVRVVMTIDDFNYLKTAKNVELYCEVFVITVIIDNFIFSVVVRVGYSTVELIIAI